MPNLQTPLRGISPASVPGPAFHDDASTRPLRVLVVVPQLRIGGAEKQAVLLSKGLRALGHHVAVATFYHGGEFEADLRAGGVPVYVVEKRTSVGLEVIAGLRRLLRQGGYDIAHSFLWPGNWRVQIAGRMVRTPGIIASTRGYLLDLGWHRSLAHRVLLPRPDLTTVNAEALKTHLVNDLGANPDRLRVIRNGLDLENYLHMPAPEEARRRLGIPSGKKVLGSVGNFHPVKNQEDLVRVFAHVRRRFPESVLVLVGNGEREPQLRRLTEELGLGGAVIFAGQSQRVTDYLAAMDLFLNSSLREGCCNAILEAMAAGLPVLAYDVGGNAELVVEGETGNLFRPGAWEEMAKRAVDLLQDPVLSLGLGMAGRQRATEVFNPDEMVLRTEALYHEVLRARQVRPVAVGPEESGRTSFLAATPADLAVTVIMPVRNEARHIRDSLEAVLHQDLGPEEFEVLVVDGRSTDGTRDIVQQLIPNHPGLRLLDNPGCIVPTAMNIGLSEARGRVIVRVDGHCLVESDYLRTALKALERTGCEGVGGKMIASGEGFWGRAIAAATSTPFGVGNARFHYSDLEGEVDTAYLGAYRRDYLKEIGGYDPTFVRNQDDELNYRIRSQGGRFYYTPKLKVRYRVRPTLLALFRQYFQYGFWKVPMYRKTGHRWRIRHFIPTAFLAALVLSLVLSPWSRQALQFAVGILALHVLFGTFWAGRSGGRRVSSVGIPAVFLTMHMAYGAGFLAGAFRKTALAQVRGGGG